MMNVNSTYDPRFVTVLREHHPDLAEVITLHPAQRCESEGTIIESADVMARFISPINRHRIQQRMRVEIITDVQGTVRTRVMKVSGLLAF